MIRVVTFLLTFLTLGFIETTAQPKLSIDSMRIDLGVMYSGATKTGKITLKNIGNQPLKILRVQPSCGCTTVKQPKSELQPNESDVVEISFNSSLWRGNVEKYVNIETNDPTSQYLAVKLTAEVKEELAPLSSSYSIWLGSLPVGKRVEQLITFKNLTSRSISIKGIAVSTPWLDARSEKKSIKPADTLTVMLAAVPAKEGYDTGSLTIQTDSKNQPSVELKVYYIGKKEN